MAKQTFTTGQVLTAAQMTSLQQTAMLGGATTAKTTSYVLTAADAGGAVTMNSASATTITVNTNLFAAGDIVTIINLGAGVTTITAGTATVSAPANASLAIIQNAGGVLYFTAAGTSIFLPFETAYAPTQVAGKNKIINGDFGIWQRGTSFASPATGSYTADRWRIDFDGSGATRTISQQTFTPGTAPVSGYESAFFYRYNQSVAGTGATFSLIAQYIEDVRTFAGQTITISFWVKTATSTTTAYSVGFGQIFGTGGSSPVYTATQNFATGTGWSRVSLTFAIPSISGKTIGTSSSLQLYINTPLNTTQTFDIWGIQLEAGSVATAFSTATGTIQGELAACQRYYYRNNAFVSNAYAVFAPSGMTASTTRLIAYTTFPVEMRVAPSSVEYGGTLLANTTNAAVAITAAALSDRTSNKIASVNYDVASGLTTSTFGFVRADNSSTAYLGFSAEL